MSKPNASTCNCPTVGRLHDVKDTPRLDGRLHHTDEASK